MSRLIKHKEEKQPREEKPIVKNIPKAKPKPVKVVPPEEPIPENKAKTNLYNHIGILVALAFIAIAIVGVYHSPDDSGYLSDARPIYNSGYDNASRDIWYNYSTDKTYFEQLTFIEKHGGETGVGKHYIPSINSKDGINKTEEKLIYAAGYTNGFTDSMVHGYGTQRDNIPQ